MVSAPIPRRDSAAYGIALLRGLLTSLPAAVAYLAGPDLVLEFANDAYRELIGGRDVLGLPVREAVPEARHEILAEILRTGAPARGRETEVWISRHGQPEQMFVDYVYQPVLDADGAVAGILLYAADVTSHVRDRRRAEATAAELAATEERYRALFETMPQGVIHYSADGSVIDVNPAARQMLGLDPAELTHWPLPTAPKAVREDGSAFPRDELPVIAALRTGEIVANVVIGMPHGQAGEQRWLRVTAVPGARDASGRPQRAYGLITDITEQRRTEAELRESTALLGRLRDANVLGVMVATQDGIQEANDAFLDMIGYTRAEVEGGRMSYETLTPPEWAAADRDAVIQLQRTGAVQPLEKEYLHRDGHRVPVLVGAAVMNWQPLRWVTFVIDLSARQRAEQERADLLERERAARAEAGQARERLTFLLNAGALAAATRDRQKLLDQVPRLLVPSLADYGVVFLPDASGHLRAAALAHRDPARAAVLDRLRELPLPAAGPLTVSMAYSSGQTQLMRDVSAGLPRWAEVAPDLVQVLARLQPQSAIAVPLLAARERLGVLMLSRGSGRPRFAETDVEVIEEIARRLAAGLANVEIAAREHTIAETLQRSLLPAGLPEIPGLDLAVRYLPATDGADVGGDWYDAFGVSGGRIALVIGDVVGHSIASASVMGQLRSLVRAYAIHHPDPLSVLRRTSSAVASLLPEALATVACAVLDTATGDFRYATAGHPAPLLIGADGHTAFLNHASGTMLGAAADCRLVPVRRVLPPGAAVLFYTDGLVEDRGRDIGEGFSALARALAGPAARTAEEICATAEDALLGTGSRADDVCLLAVRREA